MNSSDTALKSGVKGDLTCNNYSKSGFSDTTTVIIIHIYYLNHTDYSHENTSFVDLLCFCSVLCLLCLCARLFICALWSPAGKGQTSWLSFVVSNNEFFTFPLVSWVRCGT